MKLPFVISIPHCGTRVPEELRSSMALNRREILESVDSGTSEIFSRIPAQVIVQAQWSRLVVDLNRNPLQRDGKGVVALTDYHGRRIFKTGSEPPPGQIEQRVRDYHTPYHEQLQHALKRPDCLALFDCHSLNGTGPADAPDAGQKRKDIVLSNNGDAGGRPRTNAGAVTCPPDLMLTIAEQFEQQGFSVSLNVPYKGGYIINHYARQLVQNGRFAVQIEINQDLYMKGQSLESDAVQTADIVGRLTSALSLVARGLKA